MQLNELNELFLLLVIQYLRTGNISEYSDITLLTVQESYSLSVLIYAVSALTLNLVNNKRIDEVNICWNSVIRRIFGYNKWESVKAYLLGLGRLSVKKGRLNVKHLFMVQKLKFYRCLFFYQ